MPHSTPHSVKATLNYYLDPSKGGYTSFYFGTLGEKRRAFEYVDCDIQDIRGREDGFELDTHGFQYLKEETKMAVEDYDDVEKIKSIYFEECAEIMKRITGAKRVHVMGHVCRRKTWDEFKDACEGKGDMERTKLPTTARYVHVDYSYTGAQTRLEFYLPSEADSLRQYRWAIINIWRPITPVTRENLAVADARSIPESSMRPILAKFRRPEANENFDNPLTKKAYDRDDVETWSVAPAGEGEKHEWWYCKEMQPDEALLIKIFDSEEKEGVARRCPHTAFVCEEDYGKGRESVEVRCLAFW